MAIDFRLALGTKTAAEMDADDSFIVDNFPRSKYTEIWLPACEGLIDYYTTLSETLGGRLGGYGGLTVSSWIWAALSSTQTKYLNDTFYTNGLDAVVTIKMWDVERNEYAYLNCTMTRPQITQSNVENVGDVNLVAYRVDFVNVSVAAES